MSPKIDFQQQTAALVASPRRWLITGCAGFIGSNLLAFLLRHQQQVIGVDDFSSGSKQNLDDVKSNVSNTEWQQFTFVEGDIRDETLCVDVMVDVDIVLHHAALASVPLSLAEPKLTHDINVNATFQLMLAAANADVTAFVYASSSAVYGDNPVTPKTEFLATQSLSPYATSKIINEQMASMFASCYQMTCVGLRYFNIFGPRQNPGSQYGAVIPKWIQASIAQDPLVIYGDGETTRDFCFIEDVVQANIQAALLAKPDTSSVYNVGLGQQTSLNELAKLIHSAVAPDDINGSQLQVNHETNRPGDIKLSCADVSRVEADLHFKPAYDLAEGLRLTVSWYQSRAD